MGDGSQPHKEKQALCPAAAGKVEEELEADDYDNSAPADTLCFHRAPIFNRRRRRCGQPVRRRWRRRKKKQESGCVVFFSFWKSACRTYYWRAVPLPNGHFLAAAVEVESGAPPPSIFILSSPVTSSQFSLSLSLVHSLPLSAFVRLLIIKGLVLGRHRRR